MPPFCRIINVKKKILDKPTTEVDSRMLYPVDRFTTWLNVTRPSDTEDRELCSRRKGAPQLSTDQLYYHYVQCYCSQETVSSVHKFFHRRLERFTKCPTLERLDNFVYLCHMRLWRNKHISLLSKVYENSIWNCCSWVGDLGKSSIDQSLQN